MYFCFIPLRSSIADFWNTSSIIFIGQSCQVRQGDRVKTKTKTKKAPNINNTRKAKWSLNVQFSEQQMVFYPWRYTYLWKKIVIIKPELSRMPVACACCSSYLGGRDEEARKGK
jgi:hypothetical protein